MRIFNNHGSPEAQSLSKGDGRLEGKRPSTGSGLRFFAVLSCVAMLASSTFHEPVSAQAWQCRAPTNLSRPQIETAKPGQIRRTAIDGYVLALSWSREYCKRSGKRAANKLQCNGKIGDFGFILHGLWPEAKGPNYPQYCRRAQVLPRKVIAQNICMTPDVQLLQHEWAKHGTCMTRTPQAYFGAAKLMFEAIEYPDMDRLSRKGVNALGLAQELDRINEGLPANAVRVKTNRRGWLEEVRVCLGKDFMPRRCPSFVRGARDTQKVKIWRGG